MLINLCDKEVDNDGFDEIQPQKVSCKYLFKGNNSLCSTMLCQVKKYELVKMRKNVSKYISFLMNVKDAMCVWILTDDNNGKSHVVAMNCKFDSKQIWDFSTKTIISGKSWKMH